MGRGRTPLPIDQVEQALAYLQRALDRKADLFSTPAKETRRSLATLRKRGLSFARPDFVVEANGWLDRHLTPNGRKTMLTALRQRRVERRHDEELRNVRLPPETHKKLSQLALSLGLSVPETVSHLVSRWPTP